jgi:hypothetical protein
MELLKGDVIHSVLTPERGDRQLGWRRGREEGQMAIEMEGKVNAKRSCSGLGMVEGSVLLYQAYRAKAGKICIFLL